MSSPNPNDPPEQQSRGIRALLDRLKKFREEQRWEHFAEYAKENTREVFSYALLTIGLLLLFIWPLLGEMLVGIVAACYFNEELSRFLPNIGSFIEALGITRAIIVAGTFFALFVEAPFLFFGAAAVIGLKYLLFPNDVSNKR